MRKLEVIYALASIGSFLYSVAVYMVGSGTFSFIIWVFAGIFFGFLFLMERKKVWPKVPKVLKAGFGTLIGIGITIFLICQGCILTQFFSRGESGADYIIVLGAQMRDWGPSVVYKSRLDSAIEYLNSNPNTKVIVTGGQGINESISEGEGGKNYLVEQGIEEDRIIVENKSCDTDENIRNALQFIDTTDDLKIGIVTNNFHVFRGVLITKRYTDADVIGIAAFTEYLYLPNNMVRETFGILKDVF